MNGLRLPSLLAVALIGAEGIAQGTLLGPAAGYNLFSFGNWSVTNGNAQGAVAAGGSASLNGYSVNTAMLAVDYGLIVGKRATLKNGTLTGDLAYGTTVSYQGFKVDGIAEKAQPIDFAIAREQLTTQSSWLAAMAQTPGANVAYQWGGVYLTGVSSGVNIFTVDGARLIGANTVSIDAPKGSTVILNVSGKDVKLKNLGFVVKGTDASRILLNLRDATRLEISGVGLNASVLAPLAALTFNNGYANGQVVAASASGNGSYNWVQFQGSLKDPAETPEGTSLAMAAAGLILIVAFRKKEGRNRPKEAPPGWEKEKEESPPG